MNLSKPISPFLKKVRINQRDEAMRVGLMAKWDGNRFMPIYRLIDLVEWECKTAAWRTKDRNHALSS